MGGVAITQKGTYDVAVIGSGAGGLAAATFAALNGARTLLIERTEYVGGTSAFSAGTTWAPNTRLSATTGAKDSPENVLSFLDNAVGNRSPRALRKAFVEAGIDPQRPVVTSCGSGVTAAVINLALESLGNHASRLYDGAWTEWGSAKDTPVETGRPAKS
mgnify:CR=1 FL=1